MASTSERLTDVAVRHACAVRSATGEGADAIVVNPATRRWLTGLIAGILAEYLLFFVLFWNRTGPGDADQYLVFDSLQFWNAQLFGMAKQWTPLLCSGLSMAGEPQIPFMSLAMALSYVWGPLAGVKLSLLIYGVAGWVGAHLYAGLWLRVSLQRQLAAALFVGNGFFFCRIGLGHFDFAPFLMLPLLLWLLHQSVCLRRGYLGLVVGLLAAAVAVMIDGSPVTILHLLFWVSLYAVVLSICLRRCVPVLAWVCAGALAVFLDAGYLWPMVEAQGRFPRLTEDSFTSALSLLWFAILPLRGKVLPANGNGHELSVFVGPVLAWCLWRCRHWLGTQIPPAMRRPLLVVSIVSVVLGMGSLRVLHMPAWLSPFDLLRPLPGFRSINATGRYWGFLALPASLLGAVALMRVCSELKTGWKLHGMLGAVVLFQLGFQAETLTHHWIASPVHQNSGVGYFKAPEDIRYQTLNEQRQQGEVITPTEGVCDCYDMDDFLRPRVPATAGPVLSAAWVGEPRRQAPNVRMQFVSWSRLAISSDCCARARSGLIRIVLSQAFDSDWRAAGCEVYGTPGGNLAIECPVQRLRSPLSVEFHSVVSELGTRVSLAAWQVWLWALAALLAMLGLAEMGREAIAGPAAARLDTDPPVRLIAAFGDD